MLSDEVLVDGSGGDSGGLIAGLLAATSPARETGQPTPQIGIVCMTKQPVDLLTWLTYHRERCGIARFYLRVEDTPELKVLLTSAPWNSCVEAEFGSGQRDYDQQMDRQSNHIISVLPQARAHGLDFLLHIDDDELLYCPAGLSKLHACLRRAPPHAADLHMSNLEAVLPSADVADAFRHATAFRHRRGTFCAYGNGKAFGRLSVQGLRPTGPHHFACPTAGTHELPPSTAVVLHYESMSLATWQRKYTDLARRHAGSLSVAQRAPSAFYGASMAAMAELLAARSSGDAARVAAASEAARRLYEKWKVLEGPPLPPPKGAAPLVLRDRGVTIIDVFAQPRVACASTPTAGAAVDVPALAAHSDDALAASAPAAEPEAVPRLARAEVAPTPVVVGRVPRTDGSNAVAVSVAATDDDDHEDVPAELRRACCEGHGGDLSSLLRLATAAASTDHHSGGDAVANTARHISALQAAGVADAGALLSMPLEALDATLRAAKLPIGLRMRVKHAAMRVSHAVAAPVGDRAHGQGRQASRTVVEEQSDPPVDVA